MPILFFRVGYMEAYNGFSRISYGGSHPVATGEAGEMWNFRAESGRCYGYVMTKSYAGIDLSRLDDTHDWNFNDELDGVDIVFIAKHPPHGQVIVGWYKNATVFHKNYRTRHNLNNTEESKRLDYLCVADSENAILLPEQQRTYSIPHGRGFIGTSNVWYSDIGNPSVVEFLGNVANYIDHQKTGLIKRGWPKQPDKELISRIEQAAVDTVWACYEEMDIPYQLKSRERDNCGWDLEASRENELLYLEVKGHLGNMIQFELTPNEYEKMQENLRYYRVCVVLNALNDPKLLIFTPTKRKDGWLLVAKTGETVKLIEKIAARASGI